jgi:hypothetical protein
MIMRDAKTAFKTMRHQWTFSFRFQLFTLHDFMMNSRAPFSLRYPRPFPDPLSRFTT